MFVTVRQLTNVRASHIAKSDAMKQSIQPSQSSATHIYRKGATLGARRSDCAASCILFRLYCSVHAQSANIRLLYNNPERPLKARSTTGRMHEPRREKRGSWKGIEPARSVDKHSDDTTATADAVFLTEKRRAVGATWEWGSIPRSHPTPGQATPFSVGHRA